MSLLRNKVLLLDVETGAVQTEVDIRERRVCGGVREHGKLLTTRPEHDSSRIRPGYLPFVACMSAA